jgi:serine phosphatase RsbU (regulator of sigma subunit)/anti-sigma regulatory factor (Ser/Thr protein kinase)/ligand-binding sensor domain-containing protein
MVIRIIVLIFPLWCIAGSFAFSAEQGTPLLRNFLPNEYKAHAQNFAVVQDKRGFMLFANTNGVLIYDGTHWRTVSTKNYSIPRSIAVGADGKVYVGTRGDFGMLIANTKGSLEYKSLLTYTNSRPNFLDIHSILTTEKAVYFIADNTVFQWSNNKLSYSNFGVELGKAFVLGDKIYTNVTDSGLMIIDKMKLRSIPQTRFFSQNTAVVAMLPYDKNRTLVATKNDGLYLMGNDSGEPQEFAGSLKSFFLDNGISSVTRLSDGSFALGTIRRGIVLVSAQGQRLAVIERKHGLLHESINDIVADNQQGVWVALNEGLSRINAPSAFSRYGESEGLYGGVNDIAQWNGTYYVATQRGIFRKSGSTFLPVKDSVACMSLVTTERTLLAATTEGIFAINANNTISMITPGYGLSLGYSQRHKDMVYCGLLDGVAIVRFVNGMWKETARIEGIRDECRSIREDNQGNVWIATSMKGIIRCKADDLYAGIMNNYMRLGLQHGLQSLISNTISIINGKIRLTTISEPGIKQFDETQKKFIVDKELQNRTKDGKDSLLWLNSILQAQDGSIWATEGDAKKIRRYTLTAKGLQPVLPQFAPISEYSITAILAENHNKAWFGTAEGIIVFDGTAKTISNLPFSCFIRSAYYGSDSLMYGGAYYSTDGLPFSILTKNIPIPQLPYNRNTLTFEFSAPAFNFEDRTLYRYKLEGFDNVWSSWSITTKKEYTNLPDGSFTFKVEAKNVYGTIGKTAEFPFVIEKPWFRQWWAYILYLFGSGSVVVIVFRWRLRKGHKEKERLERIINERTQEIQVQKEEIEKKSGELEGKNDELAKINGIVKSINTEIDLDRLLISILERILIFKGVHRGIAYVRIGETEEFAVRASIGWNDEELQEIATVPFGIINERYIELCEELYEDVFYSGVQDDNETAQRIGNAASAIAVMTVPVNRVIEGIVIFEGNAKTRGFESRLLGLLHNLKEHIVAAFIKSKILSDLQEKNGIIEEYADLTRKQLSSIQRDLEIAAKIQHAILPDWKETFQNQPVQFTLAAEMVAAKDVGGDFYDFFRIDHRRVGFVIADVSGKGMPAALFMAVSRTMLKSQASLGGKPGDVMAVVNDLLCRENVSTLFVTVFYCILDEETGEVWFSNGGHNLPYIIRKNGTVEIVQKTRGMGLAIMDEMEFETSKFTLYNGDMLYLYTDGVTEAMNKNDELYSDERLTEFLTTMDHSVSVEEQMKNVFADVKRHADGAAQSDDITMLLLRYDGHNSSHINESSSTAEVLHNLSLRLINKKTEITRINSEVEAFYDEFSVPMKTAFQTDLILDEILTNIITHGYPQGGEHTIDLSLSVDDTARLVTITVSDGGIPFNPTTIAAADTTSDLEERAIGGLGIHFVKQISQAMEYKYHNNTNILTIVLPFRDE